MIMRMEVMTRVIEVVIATAIAATMDMMMMTATPIVRATTAEIMIARTVAVIGVNPLVIEKMKMQTYFYEEYDNDVNHYDKDIEDDAKANRWSNTDSYQYRLINVLENARDENTQANQMYHDEYPYGHLSDLSDITNVSSRSGPRYGKHGREVLELGLFYDLEPSSPTLHY